MIGRPLPIYRYTVLSRVYIFVVCLSTDEDDDDDNPDVEADEAANAAWRSKVPSSGPWLDRIMGASVPHYCNDSPVMAQ